MANMHQLILASGSARRLALLGQAGIVPDLVFPVTVDETAKKRERPYSLARRLARAKADAAQKKLTDQGWERFFLISADTVVSVGTRVIDKPEIMDDAEAGLRLLSGRAHRVHTAVTLITPNGAQRHRIVESRVRFKRLSKKQIDSYLASGEWRGKAGCYAIQGFAGSFVIRLVGSFTSIVGLPLYETVNLLEGEGYEVNPQWVEIGRASCRERVYAPV